MEDQLPPKIAILGAGTFVRNQYIPRLAEISDLVVVKAIWSRTEESARGAVVIASKNFPDVECKWGDAGLDDIIADASILGVAVVLAAEIQVDISVRLLKAGKHVLQEKPASTSILEALTAVSHFDSMYPNKLDRPIWAVAENYRFEPAFVECKNLMAEIGDMMSVQVIVEGSMNSSNPYFSSSWRRKLYGGFILDMGVHFIAGLRMLVGCDITSVSASTSYVDKTLPSPDAISSLFQLSNGCSGVFVMVVSARSPQITWRVVGLKGTLQVMRGSQDGRPGYLVTHFSADGQCQNSFYPFSGVTEELKAFIHDISQNGKGYEADPRSSFTEGANDVSVLDSMILSSLNNGDNIHVKQF